MNETISRSVRLSAGAVAVAAVALGASGCGKKDVFAKVNGQVITKEDYVQALERAPVQVPGAQQPVPASRYVLDQIIGRRIVMAEASKLGVVPTDAEIQKRLELQKRLVEQQVVGKSFEDVMKEQGTTAADLKEEIKYQLAENNLIASRLKIAEDEIKKEYEQQKEQWETPDRVQLRIIAAGANSKELQEAKKMLAAGTDFVEVARTVNQGPMKPTGGLLPQVTPVNQLPANWQGKLKDTSEGGVFGPVDGPPTPGAPPMKVWVRVEKKLPGFKLAYDDAKLLVKQRLVQVKMAAPENAKIREDILRLKMDAKFQSSEPKYQTMWQTVKDQAKASGVGAPGAAVGTAPGGGAIPPTPGG